MLQVRSGKHDERHVCHMSYQIFPHILRCSGFEVFKCIFCVSIKSNQNTYADGPLPEVVLTY